MTLYREAYMTTDKTMFGVYRRLVAAQTTNPLIRKVAQNGGAVTAMLIYAIENKIIDGAVVSAINREKPFFPVPKLATTPQEILECAGTRYAYSPNIQALSEATKQNRKSVAFVGTPCEIRVIRKMQHANPKHAERVKLLIGLMCSEAFMTLTVDAKETTIPIADIKKYAREACKLCDDFSSELADISAGNLGLQDWTLLIARTQIGQQILNQAEKAHAIVARPIQENEPAFKLLQRLSKTKHDRVKNQ
jgi:coenzyme F420 hydrogenase subunit beta